VIVVRPGAGRGPRAVRVPLPPAVRAAVRQVDSGAKPVVRKHRRKGDAA